MKKVAKLLGKQLRAIKEKVFKSQVPAEILENGEINLKNDGVLFGFIAEKITSRGIILCAIIYGLDTLFVLGLFS